jgi:hypothetical protein
MAESSTSNRLGHSSIGITADTYSHLLKNVGRGAAESASALIPRKQRDQSVTNQPSGPILRSQRRGTRPIPGTSPQVRRCLVP